MGIAIECSDVRPIVASEDTHVVEENAPVRTIRGPQGFEEIGIGDTRRVQNVPGRPVRVAPTPLHYRPVGFIIGQGLEPGSGTVEFD